MDAQLHYRAILGANAGLSEEVVHQYDTSTMDQKEELLFKIIVPEKFAK